MGHLGQLESTRSERRDGDGPIPLTRTVKTAMKERGITGKGEEDEEENSGEREKEKEKPLKWDKYRKRKEKKIESWVLIFGLISEEMDCQFAERKLYTQAIVRLLSLALPQLQLHVTPSQLWPWITPRTTSYRRVEGIGICGNAVVLLLYKTRH